MALNRRQRFPKPTPAAWLALLVAFHAALNLWVLKRGNFLMFFPDEEAYWESTRGLLSLCAHGLSLGGAWAWARDLWKPPMYFLTAAPFVAAGGDLVAGTMANIVHLAVILACVYGAAKAIYGRKAGLLAAVLASTMPGVFGLSRVFMLDIALASSTMLTLWVLCQDGWSDLRFCLSLGACVGLGFLTKQTYGVFLAGMLPFYWRSAKNRRRPLRLILGLAAGGLLALPWYAAHGRLLPQGYGAIIFSPNNFVGSPSYYLSALFFRQLMPAYFLAAAAAAALSLRRKRYFLPAYAIGLVLFWSFTPIKGERYILPVLPLLAILMAGELEGRALKALAVFGAVQCLALSAMTTCDRFPGEPSQSFSRLGQLFRPPFDIEAGMFSTVEDVYDWRGLAGRVLDDAGARPGAPQVTLMTVSKILREELPYQADIRGANVRYIRPLDDKNVAALFKDRREFADWYRRSVDSADSVYVEDFLVPWDRSTQEIVSYLRSRRADFDPPVVYKLGPDYTARLYRRKRRAHVSA